MRISDWSSDVCSSDLFEIAAAVGNHQLARHEHPEPLHEPGQFRKCGDRERRADGTPRRFIEVVQPAIGLDQPPRAVDPAPHRRSEEHTSELQSLMRISYAVFCLTKKKQPPNKTHDTQH